MGMRFDEARRLLRGQVCSLQPCARQSLARHTSKALQLARAMAKHSSATEVEVAH